MPLYWRLFLGNAALMIVAVGILVFSPFTLHDPPRPEEVASLVIGALAVLIVNAALLGNALTPLADLKDAIDTVDAPEEAPHVEVRGRDEIASLAAAYNAMLDRLDAERSRSVRAVLRGQEEERSRIARELHDEVGQSMTFLLLRMKMTRDAAPEPMHAQLDALTDAARTALDEIRTISRRLRPGALADLGIGAALDSLVEDARKLGPTTIELDVDRGIGRDAERDLVLYRVAQEALTNVVKHARASHVSIGLVGRTDARGERVVLTVVDDGVGVGAGSRDGTGTYSMRERARLVGGRFTRTAVAGGGTRIELELPKVLGSADGAAPLDPPTRPIPVTPVFPPSPYAG